MMTKSEQNSSYYQTCKRLHKCVRCGSQDARTLIGKPLCFDCCERKSEEMRGVDQSESRKRSREKAVSNGICTHCYKRKTDGVHKTCNYCREEAKRKRNEQRAALGLIPRSEAKEYGVCSLCLKNPRLPGQNTCEKCYSMVVNKFKGTQSVNRMASKIKREIEIKEWYCESKETKRTAAEPVRA